MAEPGTPSGTEPTLPASDLGEPELPRAGLVVGERYEVRSELGAGSMGIVVLARDRQLDRDVAVKLLRTTAPVGSPTCRNMCARLAREARAMARLNHPNLVTVYDVGTHQDRVFVVMEYVSGTTLADLIGSERPWPERLELLAQAGRGLAEAHRAHVVHRDFKPANVLVTESGVAKVGDFGLARSIGGRDLETPEHCAEGPTSDRLTGHGHIVGTPRYMSPEQHRGEEVTAASDQFSFAVSTYELLYERMPFRGPPDSTPIEPPTGEIPAGVGGVIARALALDPAERFETMDDLLEELLAARRARAGWLRRVLGRLSPKARS